MSAKERLSVSVDVELVAAAHQAVESGQTESVSAWVSEALRLKVRHDQRMAALDDFIAAYEAEHGEITEQEMREAARWARSRAVVVRGDSGSGHSGGGHSGGGHSGGGQPAPGNRGVA